jgi:hypothetical protein
MGFLPLILPWPVLAGQEEFLDFLRKLLTFSKYYASNMFLSPQEKSLQTPLSVTNETSKKPSTKQNKCVHFQRATVDVKK